MRARVISNREVAPGIFLLTSHSPSLARSSRPGNFVMVRVCEGYWPLLRRPLSIHDVVQEEVSVLFEVRGAGTRCLSSLRPGQEIDMLGPLGNGFPAVDPGHEVVLVAGGVGIAPFAFLVRSLRGQEPPTPVHLFAGGRTVAMIPGLRTFEEWGVELWLATEDGSVGHHGMVSELFRREGRRFQAGVRIVFACGPWEMLQAVASQAAALGLACMISLESRMGCGVGACLGCGVRVRGQSDSRGAKPVRYARVCTEGPVFDALDVVWE